MRSMQYWKEKFRHYYKMRQKKLKKLKLMLKYFQPRPIYIASKQDNNCFLQNRMEFEAERTAA